MQWVLLHVAVEQIIARGGEEAVARLRGLQVVVGQHVESIVGTSQRQWPV